TARTPRRTSALVRKLSAPISSLGPKRPQFLGASLRSSLKCTGLVAAIVLLSPNRSSNLLHYRVTPSDANPRAGYGGDSGSQAQASILQSPATVYARNTLQC